MLFTIRSGQARVPSVKKVVRKRRKLASDTPLFGVVDYFLRQRWSPEQISGTLRRLVCVAVESKS